MTRTRRGAKTAGSTDDALAAFVIAVFHDLLAASAAERRPFWCRG